MGEEAPNEVLRGLREAMPSGVSPGEGMSRQELAERVAAYVWEAYGREVGIDAKYVGKLERGYIARPRTAVYREALRSIFGVATDRELGFGSGRSGGGSGSTDEVDRRSMIRGVAALGGAFVAAPGPMSGMLRDLTPMPVPGAVGRREVEVVRDAAESFDRLDVAHGGGLVRPAAVAQLRWAAALLDGRFPNSLRGELFGAVGYLAYVTGFMAFDDGANGDADRLFGFALRCAEEVDDWSLRAIVLHGLGSRHRWAGDFDTALTYADQAFVRADRLTPIERTGLLGMRARSLAQMGRNDDALAAVGQMDDEFVRSRPGEAPPWMSFYTEAQHLSATGGTYLALALDGVGTARSEAVRRSTAGLDSGQVGRSAAFTRVEMAMLGMSDGDVDEGVAYGNAVLDTSGSIRSWRLRKQLADLYERAGQHAARSDVAQLRERLATTLAA